MVSNVWINDNKSLKIFFWSENIYGFSDILVCVITESELRQNNFLQEENDTQSYLLLDFKLLLTLNSQTQSWIHLTSSWHITFFYRNCFYISYSQSPEFSRYDTRNGFKIAIRYEYRFYPFFVYYSSSLGRISLRTMYEYWEIFYTRFCYNMKVVTK